MNKVIIQYTHLKYFLFSVDNFFPNFKVNYCMVSSSIKRSDFSLNSPSTAISVSCKIDLFDFSHKLMSKIQPVVTRYKNNIRKERIFL